MSSPLRTRHSGLLSKQQVPDGRGVQNAELWVQAGGRQSLSREVTVLHPCGPRSGCSVEVGLEERAVQSFTSNSVPLADTAATPRLALSPGGATGNTDCVPTENSGSGQRRPARQKQRQRQGGCTRFLS